MLKGVQLVVKVIETVLHRLGASSVQARCELGASSVQGVSLHRLNRPDLVPSLAPLNCFGQVWGDTFYGGSSKGYYLKFMKTLDEENEHIPAEK